MSPVYGDFLHQRLSALVSAAKAALEGKPRDELLACAVDLRANMSTLAEGEGEDALVAQSLFCSSLALGDRVVFLMDSTKTTQHKLRQDNSTETANNINSTIYAQPCAHAPRSRYQRLHQPRNHLRDIVH